MTRMVVPEGSLGPSFSIRHRLLRVAFGVVWVIAARPTPRALHRWRRLILNAFGAKLARGVVVYPDVSVWYPPNLTMAEGASLASGVECYCMAPVTIGAYTVISQGAYLCAGTHEVHSPSFPLVRRPITIGASAWVAARAFIGPGVTVGDGAVLGACGVATRDLVPWTVYAGNPAVRVRERRTEGCEGR